MHETATPRSGWMQASRIAWTVGSPVVVLALLVFVGATRGESVLDAVRSVPPWAIVGAIMAHLLTLALRTEAWRTVLRAAGGERLSSQTLYAANAGAFLAGTVQGQAAMPTRIALLRRFGGKDSPEVSQIALADAPIFMFEVCTTAVLAAVGSTAVGMIPTWVPWAMLGGALAVLVALRIVYARFRQSRFAAGLGVLARPDLRARLAIVVVAFTVMALLRTWIVLAGFGLPTDPAHICLVLFTMGTVGLLPIGVGTGPTATVAAVGTTNLAAATAAGMVVSAATVLAVLIYAGACWAWRARVPAPAAA
ncbi:MAG TPA: lysylphosphatidylglycerol synthase domain-containing protein [Solirubrobacterales bacterium]